MCQRIDRRRNVEKQNGDAVHKLRSNVAHAISTLSSQLNGAVASQLDTIKSVVDRTHNFVSSNEKVGFLGNCRFIFLYIYIYSLRLLHLCLGDESV